MDEFLTSLLVIGAEFGVSVGVILLIVFFIHLKRKRNDKNIAREFTDDFKESNNARKEDLENAIIDAFQLNGEEGKEYAKIIMSNERKICSNMLSLFNGKDRALLLQLQGDLANISEAYSGIASMSKSNNATAQDNVTDKALTEKVTVMSEENTRLKEDLKKALESIDYLQNQYTELFKKTNPEQD